MSSKKTPNESTKGPKAPLSHRERGLKIGQELVDNLNRKVAAEHPDSNPPEPVELTPQEKARRLQVINEVNRRLGRKTLKAVPSLDEGERKRQAILADLRKNFPHLAHLSDQEIIEASGGLL